MFSKLVPSLVRLSFWASALCITWLCCSWLAHRFQSAATRVRFRDFVHLGRLRVAAAVLAGSAVLWGFYFWPGPGLPKGASLEEVTLEVATSGWDAYAQVDGVTAGRELSFSLTPEEAGRLEEIVSSHTRIRSLYGRQRYELGAVTVRGQLDWRGQNTPLILVSTENQAYWLWDGYCYLLLGHDRLMQEMVSFAQQLNSGR